MSPVGCKGVFEVNSIRYAIAVVLLFFCTLVLPDSAELPLQCKESVDSKGDVYLSIEGVEYLVRNAKRQCSSEYLYRKKLGESKYSMIISLPASEDLGLNAKSVIYFISQGGYEAIYVGEVPTSATELENGSYQNIVQAGGAVYETVYKLESDKITILSPGKELVIADTECVYESSADSECKNMSGTFDKPLCLLNYSGRKVLVGMKRCAGMLD